jgi:hypothetical protein
MIIDEPHSHVFNDNPVYSGNCLWSILSSIHDRHPVTKTFTALHSFTLHLSRLHFQAADFLFSENNILFRRYKFMFLVSKCFVIVLMVYNHNTLTLLFLRNRVLDLLMFSTDELGLTLTCNGNIFSFSLRAFTNDRTFCNSNFILYTSFLASVQLHKHTRRCVPF